MKKIFFLGSYVYEATRDGVVTISGEININEKNYFEGTIVNFDRFLDRNIKGHLYEKDGLEKMLFVVTDHSNNEEGNILYELSNSKSSQENYKGLCKVLGVAIKYEENLDLMLEKIKNLNAGISLDCRLNLR